MRRATPFLLLLVVAGRLTTPPVGAQSGSEARCTFSAGSELDPGLSIRPGSGEFWTNGDSGLLHCEGLVRGQRTTGTGTIGFEGRYGAGTPGDSCLTGGGGSGRHVLFIPTEAGTVRLENPFEFTYGAAHLDSPMAGTFKGRLMSGRFEVSDQDGDCVTAPIRLVRIDGEGVLRT